MDKNLTSFFSLRGEDFLNWTRLKLLRDEVALDFFRNTFGVKKKRSYDFPSSVKLSIGHDFCFSLPKITNRKESVDGTIKYLITFSDGKSVEAVALPFFKNYTLCLSSQVGCAMKCNFCLTGTQGLERNLLAHEIVGQYLAVFFDLKEKKISLKKPNIVFMGQGEPLHNFEELKKSLFIFTDRNALSLAPDKITVSTSGYMPGIERFDELPPVNVALSLHATSKELRDELIPLNKKYDWEIVIEKMFEKNPGRRGFLNVEYLLLGGKNDSLEDAKRLADHLKGKDCFVNIIPFNPYPGSIYKRPSAEEVELFKKSLVDEKIKVMVRQTKGDDILAACGQLKSNEKKG